MKEFWKLRKTMSFGQWIIYLWEYYAGMAAVVLLVGAFVIYLIAHMFMGKELIFSGLTVNCVVDPICATYLTDEFFETVGGNAGKEEIDFTTDLFIQEGAENMNNSRMLLEARTVAGEIDYMIIDAEALEIFRKKDAYADLGEILKPETMEKLSDRLVTLRFENPEFGDEYAAAIRLDGSAFAEKVNLRPEEAYLVFMVNGKHMDGLDTFVNYLFE